MFCKNCGTELRGSMKFCPGCGAAITASAAPAAPEPSASATPETQSVSGAAPSEESGGQQHSERLVHCEDGVYRWIYEYSLFKHPGLFFLIWRVFFFVMLGIFAFMLILNAFEGDLDGARLLDTLKYLGIGTLGMTALVGISYLIYAAIMGGKYIAVFEMDENGITHRQIDRQAKRTNAIGNAAFVVGLLTHNYSSMAAGMNVRSEMHTSFRSTGKARAYPRKHLIKLREMLTQNQVFAHPEDFEFVKNYIFSRVPEKARK